MRTKRQGGVACGALAALPVCLLWQTDLQAQDVVLKECVALVQDVGRIEPDMAAELSRMTEGSLHLVDAGSPSYTSDDVDDPATGWIELFGAQNGHGSSLLGFFRKDNFECTILDQ
ncbi:MAG: hypothetical protein JJ926_18045 [Roseitalea sp.]|nr:hypothetical protein [Roseitalea sp.]MBO6953783.1 hypothetical protein [Rhizobiaceae bacterium]MBO6594131.1 hypothetical protein [Roseitalea sp.]MBO6601436.1 hypothetical protein [Roseitalea sp.]MBO6613526.1 hypothetical protein [Roseitalea sp.]